MVSAIRLPIILSFFHPFCIWRYDLGKEEKDELARSMSLDDFMDVCQVICNMNGVNFSRRERALVDFYDAIR